MNLGTATEFDRAAWGLGIERDEFGSCPQISERDEFGSCPQMGAPHMGAGW
jgi:hypothetical protein